MSQQKLRDTDLATEIDFLLNLRDDPGATVGDRIKISTAIARMKGWCGKGGDEMFGDISDLFDAPPDNTTPPPMTPETARTAKANAARRAKPYPEKPLD